MELPLQAAATPQTLPPPDGTLTPQKKAEWNEFVNYLDKKGLKGSTLLDNRDKGLGQQVLNDYKKANPNFSLSYGDVKNVQTEFQNIRKQFVSDYRAGKVNVDGVKSEDDLMSDLSEADGWLGSKTTSHKFPTAIAKRTDPNGTTVKNYGTDMAAYQAATAAHAASIANYKQ